MMQTTIQKETDGRVYLFFEKTHNPKVLGKIITSPGGMNILSVSRESSAHLFKNFNAFGFCKDLVDEEWFEYMHLIVDKNKEFMIPRKDIILHSKIYEAEGYEKQYFMEMSRIKEYRV